jgi:hypothetical protein
VYSGFLVINGTFQGPLSSDYDRIASHFRTAYGRSPSIWATEVQRHLVGGIRGSGGRGTPTRTTSRHGLDDAVRFMVRSCKAKLLHGRPPSSPLRRLRPRDAASRAPTTPLRGNRGQGQQ